MLYLESNYPEDGSKTAAETLDYVINQRDDGDSPNINSKYRDESSRIYHFLVIPRYQISL